jgi:hypothetical protein
MTPKIKRKDLAPLAVGDWIQLRVVEFRIPTQGDLYLGKDARVHRCKEPRQYSTRANLAPILKESWL